jgi:hypothetical protein
MFYNIHPLLYINPLCSITYSCLNFVLSSVLYLSSQRILVLCASLCCALRSFRNSALHSVVFHILFETLRFTLLCSTFGSKLCASLCCVPHSVRNSALQSAVFYILFTLLCSTFCSKLCASLCYVLHSVRNSALLCILPTVVYVLTTYTGLGLQARSQRLCSTHELRILCWNFRTIYGGLGIVGIG